ncbi:acetylxylan esterase [Trueperella sp. LYQ143]|uniref:acetylxylan esterase n=1 Tax=unclassified Trueperella TaxID=2630174 RepID=UPI003983B6B6
MTFFDMSLDQLETYRPTVREPQDFDDFWRRTLAENPFDPQHIQITDYPSRLRSVRVRDVMFPGFGGTPIAAWLITPVTPGPHPVIVRFIGYGGGRGFPEENLIWASAGFAEFIVDNRGQGGGFGSGGNTRDCDGGGPATSGCLTRGILNPDEYYYRRLFTDAHHAVCTLAHIPDVDPQQIITAGGSQGGALAITAAALHPDIRAVMADVPFLCHIERSIGLTGAQPWAEIVRFLSVNRDSREAVYHTLSYFDVVNMAKRATAPALFSTALMDMVCPPSTVYAMKNWYNGPHEIAVYHFNGHEGGGTYQIRRQLSWLTQTILQK